MAKPKKEKELPKPLPRKCGREPVVAKGKSRGWIVACPVNTGCTFNHTCGGWPTAEAAVEDWNERVNK